MSVLQYLFRFHFLNFILRLVVLPFRHSRNCNRTWISTRSACISSVFICRNFTIHFVYIVVRMRQWLRLREIWVGLTPDYLESEDLGTRKRPSDCSVAVWSSVADMSSHLVTNNERSSFHQWNCVVIMSSVIILAREGINVVDFRRRLAFKSRHFEPNTNANWTIARWFVNCR